ncbi:MAG: acyl carrier protein [Candidatus Omnitrophica bacterium]|nr:acyl carrier protein [Candidatus Omnitrophota bacterium]
MKEKIRKFIIDNFMYGKGKLKDDISLFDSGIMDSLGFIKLLAFIEKTFRVSIDMSEVAIDNFDTVDEIVKTVSKKKRPGK